MVRFLYHLILVTSLAVHNVLGDYECVCNYKVEQSVLTQPDVQSQPLGFMYEFDCKPLATKDGLDTSKWHAIAFEHKLAFVQTDPQIQEQICPGSPNAFDILTTTTPKPTTPTTTTPTTPKLTTHKPTTQKPTTQKPTTPKPTTQKPTTPKPTTQKPTTPRPTTQAPTTPELTTQKPTTPKSTTQKQTTQKPTTPELTTRKPTTLKPTTQKPTTQKPTTQKPTTLKPTTPKPTTQKPATPKSTTQKPTTHKPTTQKPTTVKLTTRKPTTRMSTRLITTTPKLSTKPTTPTTTSTTTPDPITGNINLCPLQVQGNADKDGSQLAQYQTHCYELLLAYNDTWSNAEAQCVKRGGHLADITDVGEERFLTKFLQTFTPDHAVWIGLNDRKVEGTYVWSSGVTTKYFNWFKGHTNHFLSHIIEDCTVMIPYQNGAWDDLPCQTYHNQPVHYPTLCEYKIEP